MITWGFDMGIPRILLRANRKIRYKYDADHIIFVLLGAALFMFKQLIRFTAQRVIPVRGEVV